MHPPRYIHQSLKQWWIMPIHRAMVLHQRFVRRTKQCKRRYVRTESLYRAQNEMGHASNVLNIWFSNFRLNTNKNRQPNSPRDWFFDGEIDWFVCNVEKSETSRNRRMPDSSEPVDYAHLQTMKRWRNTMETKLTTTIACAERQSIHTC